MALDFREIRKTVIASINAAIGSDLSQTYNPVLDESYGTILTARPNKELPVPEYPYAVLDITGVKDTDWHITNMSYDDELNKFYYETHRTLDMQISIYGGDAISLANKLVVAYRVDTIREILISGGLGLVDVKQVQILPELLQTDFLEVAFVKLSVRANDKTVDEDLTSIDDIVLTGELEGALVQDPMTISVDTTLN
jgi:hypothetical protein